MFVGFLFVFFLFLVVLFGGRTAAIITLLVIFVPVAFILLASF